MTRQSLPDAEVPDPGRITSKQDFGRELTLARQQAGLTIREVAKASGIPVSTLGDYFAARHLPPARQPELLPSILAACQITEAEQVDRWLDALNRVHRGCRWWWSGRRGPVSPRCCARAWSPGCGPPALPGRPAARWC